MPRKLVEELVPGDYLSGYGAAVVAPPETIDGTVVVQVNDGVGTRTEFGFNPQEEVSVR